jgi:hypothetical protein
MKNMGTIRLVNMKGALLGPLVAQLLLLMLAALILDGGIIASFCMAGAVAHWVMVTYLAIRRRDALTRVDQILVRLGFVIFTVVAIVLVILVGLVAAWLDL